VLDVTLPDELSALVILAIFYSMLPFLVIGGMLVIAVSTRRLFWTFAVALVGVIIVLNEGIIKRIVQEKRPDGSCLHSFGMPSSHSAISMGLLAWVLLEMIIGQSLIPTMLFLKRGWISLLFLVTCVPVPWSRVMLKDHSTLQVFIGSGVGICIAVLYFVFLRCVAIGYIDEWEGSQKASFHNDYSKREHHYTTGPASGDVKYL